jgi:hypothetical protein
MVRCIPTIKPLPQSVQLIVNRALRRKRNTDHSKDQISIFDKHAANGWIYVFIDHSEDALTAGRPFSQAEVAV